MLPLETLIERSLRKSRGRVDVLLYIDAAGRAYLGKMSRDLAIRPDYIRGILIGALPFFCPVKSLIGLDLVREAREGRRVAYVLTPRGRRVAAILRMRRGVGMAPFRNGW